MLKIPYDESADFNELEFFVMALEDRRFLRHCGFDFLSFIRDALKMIQRKKHGGFSTIDMQMVRTITNFKEQTFYRKLYEITLSLLVNFKYTKKQIIRCYLTNAFFGSHLIGVNKTSLEVFKQETHSLNQDNQAFIAAMLLREGAI
ncbi:transglycosylase domain-containing protein [Phytobacter sp. V91]|uniref:transglycosylase domain-containing protein n=1 Tax=Phytobacter sp. V91 TaxID=3369425 RepID=UPI003F5E0CF6